MGEITGIAWTDHTFNPWIGCTKVSPGCAHCYAAESLPVKFHGIHWGPGQPRHITSESNWKLPIRWAKAAAKAGVRRKVFCASLADVFEAEAPVTARRRLWDLIGETFYALDWQLVTKRPERITEVMIEDGLNLGFFDLCRCWLLTTTENQEQADKRIPHLLDVDAAVHGVSVEPMLGPVDLDERELICKTWRHGFTIGTYLDWVICGGESGPGARPCNVEWLRSIVEHCKAAWVPCFVKQFGAHPIFGQDGWSDIAADKYGVKGATWDNEAQGWDFPITDRAGRDPAEWPADLRVQQFPEVARG